MDIFIVIINALLVMFSFIIFYTYIGYPLIIGLLAKVFGNNKQLSQFRKRSKYLPPIAIILVLYNEKKHIINKLDNLLNLYYPRERISVVIVDDGSTDGSDMLIKDYIEKLTNEGSRTRMTLLRQEHKGKAEGINKAMSFVKRLPQTDKSYLIMFCDARQKIDPNAILYLIRWFQHDKVGYVSGKIVTEKEKGAGLYWEYETRIRRAESDFHSVVGGTGQLSLCRPSLIPHLPSSLILDDVFIPMHSALRGKLVLLDDRAIAYDVEFDLKSELQRKYRTLCGNFQLLSYLPSLLSFIKNPLAFEYWSHKVLRLIVPIFLVLLLICSVISLIWGSLFGLTLFSAQMLFYSLCLLGKFIRFPLFRLPYSILSLNIAVVVGFVRFLRKDCGWTKD